MLWTLRYRRAVAGVTTGFLETQADDLAIAEQVGRAWCEQQPGARYIGVERAVLATDALIGVPRVAPAAPPAPVKPSVGEQRAQQAARTAEAAATGSVAPALQPNPGVAPGMAQTSASEAPPASGGRSTSTRRASGSRRGGRVGT